MVTRCFLTFGGGKEKYHHAAERLSAEIRNLKVFDKVLAVTDRDLFGHPDHAAFVHEFGEFMRANQRGFGYWCWKPYLVCRTIDELADGDILVYGDGGCESGLKKDFEELFRDLEKSPFICSGTGHDHVSYCKQKTLDVLDPDGLYRSRAMRAATVLSATIGPETRQFFHDWLALVRDTSLITDPGADEPQCPEFRSHRHDQAVLSLLLYSRYGHLLGGREVALSRALLRARTRHGKSGKYLRNFLDGSHSPLTRDCFESVVFSSSSAWSTDLDASDVICHFKSPDRSSGHRPFTFHTGSERQPYVKFKFKACQQISLILVENRFFWEQARFDRLVIKCSDDDVTYRELASFSYHFGSTHDNSPLVLSLPYNFRTRFILVQAVNESAPRPLHLNAVLFFAG